MKVILLEDVKKLGKKYEVCDVASGYAHNNLIPKKLAVPATPQAEAKLAQKISAAEAENEKAVQAAKETLGQLEGQTVTVTVKANEKGGLYAKLDADDVAELVNNDKGAALTADMIALEEPIAEAGNHAVNLYAGDVQASFTLELKGEE